MFLFVVDCVYDLLYRRDAGVEFKLEVQNKIVGSIDVERKG